MENRQFTILRGVYVPDNLLSIFSSNSQKHISQNGELFFCPVCDDQLCLHRISHVSACTVSLYICQYVSEPMSQRQAFAHLLYFTGKRKITQKGKALEALLVHIKEMNCVIQQWKAKILHCNDEAVLGLAASFYCLFSFITFLSKVILEHF